MKQPIKHEDIREGDLVMFEWDKPVNISGEVGRILVAQCDRQWPILAMRAFLLERPEPAVKLPTSPTLGWVTVPYSGASLGEWSVDGHYLKRDGSYRACEDVTAFTPATAVPTEALDKLRRGAIANPRTRPDVDEFLAAVDAANGSQS